MIESELVGGYTAVGLAGWTGTNPTSSDQLLYGVNVRAYLIFINNTRVGLEVGNRHFFTWRQRIEFGSTAITNTTRVAGFHFGLVVRACDRPRFDCDVGYGFHILGEDDVLPGAHLGMNYLLVKKERFTIPVGARADLLFGDQSVALPLALKTGFTWSP
jgi:hypothetical protein